MFVCISYSEGHIGLERKVTKLEAMVKMLQEDLKKVLEELKTRDLSKYSHSSAVSSSCIQFQFIPLVLVQNFTAMCENKFAGAFSSV